MRLVHFLQNQFVEENLIGESHEIVSIRNSIRDIAQSNLNILIRGESGTGKDIVARLVHLNSDRVDHGNFLKINCPAIPEYLFESELFGHEKGAFTGADKSKPGRIEIASKGTLFLDEIAEIPITIQSKLLQFIEHKHFVRVGGVQNLEIDTRIVSATNALLEKMIKQKKFRADLYYRLNEYCIHMPPLRERVSDIPVLIEYFVVKFAVECNCAKPVLSQEIMQKMEKYEWPGNVRELKAVLQSYFYSHDESALLRSLESRSVDITLVSKGENLKEMEKEAIRSALLKYRWNQRKAAQALGISYSSIRRKIKLYDL